MAQVKTVLLHQLKPVDCFLLSYPIQPERYGQLNKRLQGLPLLVINEDHEIIFGIDYYSFLQAAGVSSTEVLVLSITEKEGLFLNYNLKEQYTGVNLYEKLLFVQKILPLAQRQEIYSHTSLDIAIEPDLEKKLAGLLSPVFQEVLTSEHITLKAALWLCNFEPLYQPQVIDLFQRVAFTSSQQLKFLEMLEEVLFRDKCPIAEIWAKLDINSFLELEKPQKAIMEALFCYRYPRYAETETEWQNTIKKLALPGHMQISHAPFFDKQSVDLTIHLQTPAELHTMLAKLRAAF